MDLSIGALLVLASLPIVAVLAFGSAIAFRAWPLFRQRRIGRRGRPFMVVKIRTLPLETPRAADKHSLTGLVTGRYGRLLRRYHLDKLPQLWLVPLGCMSLVGPRPEMVELINRYAPEFAKRRATVRPGCTGLWQISVAAAGLIYEAPEYDEFYLENRSLRLDAWIMRKALLACLGRPVAVTLQDAARYARSRRGAESGNCNVLSAMSMSESQD